MSINFVNRTDGDAVVVIEDEYSFDVPAGESRDTSFHRNSYDPPYHIVVMSSSENVLLLDLYLSDDDLDQIDHRVVIESDP